MSQANSYYDALSICTRLEPYLDGVAPSEIHLFAYLACLLALYRKQPTAEWGYSFATIREGYPYSAELENTLTTLTRKGYLERDKDSFLHTTSTGKEELSFLQSLSSGNNHEVYITGACDSISSLPLGVIRNAINESPDLSLTKSLGYTRRSPSDGSEEIFYEHFDALSQAVGIDIQDLMIPAVIWLRFLSTAYTQEASLNENT